MLIKKTKDMTDSERIAAENSNNQYLRTLTYAPVGMIIPFGGETVPGTFLVCDGSGLDTTEYADLFNAIGYTYGGSDDTFNIPNLSGATVNGISVKYIIKTANGITQQEVNDIIVNAVPKIAINTAAIMDAVICLKEGASPNENGVPVNSDYTYKTIDTGSYAGKENTLPGGIAARDDNGNLWTGEPVDDVDCANKKYVNDITDNKANGRIPKPSVQFGAPIITVTVMNHNDYTIITNPDTTDEYIANDSAFKEIIVDDGTVWAKENVSAAIGCIPTRDENGNLWTGTPIDDQDCVPLSMYNELLKRVEALEQNT